MGSSKGVSGRMRPAFRTLLACKTTAGLIASMADTHPPPNLPLEGGGAVRRWLEFMAVLPTVKTLYFEAVGAISGSSFFLSLPATYGLHGCALIGSLVFHTTLN